MRPIPTIEDPERYTDSAFVDSAFIELKSCDLWDVKMLYPILHMDHAEEKCFVRKEMYERLVKAAGNLPDGYRFRIWDANVGACIQRAGLYDIAIKDEWIYPKSGVIFHIKKA